MAGPSRLIIPAQFKLLFNCRVALRCNSAIESRQIIDDASATTLPKYGMGIVQKDTERYYIQIPYYTDNVLNDLVRQWNKQHPILDKLMKTRI